MCVPGNRGAIERRELETRAHEQLRPVRTSNFMSPLGLLLVTVTCSCVLS